MGAGQGYGICTAVYILVYGGYTPTHCVDSSVCPCVLSVCLFTVVYTVGGRARGRGRRAKMQQSLRSQP